MRPWRYKKSQEIERKVALRAHFTSHLRPSRIGLLLSIRTVFDAGGTAGVATSLHNVDRIFAGECLIPWSPASPHLVVVAPIVARDRDAYPSPAGPEDAPDDVG
jgi:hypothetical protein